MFDCYAVQTQEITAYSSIYSGVMALKLAERANQEIPSNLSNSFTVVNYIEIYFIHQQDEATSPPESNCSAAQLISSQLLLLLLCTRAQTVLRVSQLPLPKLSRH